MVRDVGYRVRVSRLLLAVLLLGACDRGPSSDELARRDRMRAERTDPAITDALADPILADRGLRVQDGSLQVRATPGPVSVTTPPANGEPPLLRPVARCDGPMGPRPNLLLELPAALALPPGARPLELSARDAPGCRIRFVRFTGPAGPAQVLDLYEARARRAGYPAERGAREDQLLLSGVTADLAYMLIVGPGPRGGSEGALVLNIAPPAP